MPRRISRSSKKLRCRRWPSRPPPSKPPHRPPPHPRLLLPLRPRTTSPAQLQQLATLKEQGVLSDEEFAAAKAKLLGG